MLILRQAGEGRDDQFTHEGGSSMAFLHLIETSFPFKSLWQNDPLRETGQPGD
jgi:hypothetical protein